jgi:glycosyltransferase involved in cell wall biosynthesis
VTRVTLLTEIPAPYRIPLFIALAERVDLRVLFLARRNPERPYDLHEDELRFDWRVLPGVDRTVAGRWIVVNRGVMRALRDADALLLGGWNQPAFVTALMSARRPAYVWVESTLRDSRRGGGGLKRMLARRAAGFVVPGRASEEYVRTLVPNACVTVAPNAVDNTLFASRVSEREQLRAELGLDGCVFLYVGRLAPEKGVDVLLRAFAGLDGAQLVLAGSGEDEPRLRAGAPPGTRFVGWVARDDLPRWLAAADTLVLPSLSEPWGMPLNEGAAAGLPLVSTTAVGAAWELIDDGVNGFRVEPGQPEPLTGAMRRLADDESFRHAAGVRSRKLVSRFTADAWADAVAAAVQ